MRISFFKKSTKQYPPSIRGTYRKLPKNNIYLSRCDGHQFTKTAEYRGVHHDGTIEELSINSKFKPTFRTLIKGSRIIDKNYHTGVTKTTQHLRRKLYQGDIITPTGLIIRKNSGVMRLLHGVRIENDGMYKLTIQSSDANGVGKWVARVIVQDSNGKSSCAELINTSRFLGFVTKRKVHVSNPL